LPFLGAFELLIVLTIGHTFISMLGEPGEDRQYEAAFSQTVFTEGKVKPALEYKGQNKLVLCEPGENRDFWSSDSLVPPSYRSATVKDVGGIIIRYKSMKVLARYIGNKTVSTAVYTIKIFDPYNGVIVASETFQTDKEPPETLRGDGYVLYPNKKQMTNWVNNVWSDYCQSVQ